MVRNIEAVVRYTPYAAVNVASVERAPNSCATTTLPTRGISTVTRQLTSADCYNQIKCQDLCMFSSSTEQSLSLAVDFEMTWNYC